MNVSIIGGGIMGLSVARSLLKKGIQVRLFEQFTIPHSKGSSCDDHRLIRYPYGTHAGYMMMVREAYEAWNAVWQDVNAVHYEQTGTIVTSRTGEGWAKDSLNALNQAGIPLTLLHAHQLKDYLPLYPLENVNLAYYLESGGVLFAKRILQALKHYLQTSGVLIQEKTKVSAIDVHNKKVTSESGTVFDFDHLVVTAGPWTKDLFPDIGITPSQQTVYYLDVPESDRSSWQRSPMLLDIDPGSGFYIVPPVAGLGLKIGDHRFTLTGHPDTPNPEPEAPDFIYPVARKKTCFYTVAPDEEFIYEQKEGVHVLTGFSGHGFKFGPVIGDRFADMITGSKERDYFSHWLAGKE